MKFVSKALSIVIFLTSIPSQAQTVRNTKSLFTDPLTVQGLDASSTAPDQIHYLKLTPTTNANSQGVLFESCERASFNSQGPDNCVLFGKGFYSAEALEKRSREMAKQVMRANGAALLSFVVIFGATFMWFSVGPISHGPGTSHNTIIIDNFLEGVASLGALFMSFVAGGAGVLTVEWILHPGPQSYTWDKVTRKADQNAKSMIVDVPYSTLVKHVSNVLMGI